MTKTFTENCQLVYHVASDSVKNNKLLLLSGAILGESVGIFYMGAPNIDLGRIYKCFTALSEHSPYLKAAVGGAIVLGIGKILMKSLFFEMENKAKELGIALNRETERD